MMKSLFWSHYESIKYSYFRYNLLKQLNNNYLLGLFIIIDIIYIIPKNLFFQMIKTVIDLNKTC